MRTVVVVLMACLFSVVSWAEHDATYCGKLLDGRAGKDAYNGRPDAILAVETRVRGGVDEPWDEGYGALYGIRERDRAFVAKAIQASARRGTLFCVKARWGGAAYSSMELDSISLITDAIERIDYMSAFVR